MPMVVDGLAAVNALPVGRNFNLLRYCSTLGGQEHRTWAPWISFFAFLVASGWFLPRALPALPSSTAAVVVERVEEGAALGLAGLKTGDVVRAWRQGSDAAGGLDSVFDWQWLEIERAPRGEVLLEVERAGEGRTLVVPVGRWESAVRPAMSAAKWHEILAGRQLLADGAAPGMVVTSWLRLRDETTDPRLICWLWLEIAEVWLGAGNQEEAEKSWQEAWRAASGPRSAVAVLDALAAGRRRLQDLDGAQAALQRALALRRETWGDSLELGHGLFSLGSLAWSRGDLQLTDQMGRQALEIRQRLAPGSLVVARTLNGLGLVARERGELEQAREDLRQSLEIWRRLAPGSIRLTDGLNNFGVVAWDLFDLDGALDYFLEAHEIRQRLAPGSTKEGGILNNLGLVALERGDLEGAEDYQLRALAIFEEHAADSLDVSDILHNLGDIAHRLGRETAAGFFERSWRLRQRLAPGSLQEAESLYKLATLAHERKDLKRARELGRRTVEIMSRLAPGRGTLALALQLMGRIERERGNRSNAAELFAQAIDTLEGQIGKLGGSHDQRTAYRARYRSIYRDAIQLALDLGRPERAFHFLERSRARGFLALLAEKDLAFGAEVRPQLEEARRHNGALIDEVQFQLARLDSTSEGDAVARLRSQLQRLLRERGEILAESRRASPRLAALRQPRPLDVVATRQVLDPGTAMVSYSVGAERTDVFIVTREGGLRTFSIDRGEELLRGQVEKFLAAIETKESGTNTTSWRLAKDLFLVLMAPAVPALEEAERLLLIPDGPLHRLPFGALVRPAERECPWQYLVEWKPIHSALSATVYAELRQRGGAGNLGLGGAETGAANQLVAFGDPVYPPRFQDPEKIPEARLRSAVEQRFFDWSPLPASRREVEGIAAFYEESRIFLGQQATEEEVKGLGSSVRILHFATHGFLDDRIPLNSGLVLSVPETFAAGQDNGLLQVWEIFEQVRLAADLVVLSACRSALGRELDGEGMIGLTRAFQHAGARTVGATLWSVSDQVAAEFMVKFYRHLALGLAKNEALRAAQLELIHHPVEVVSETGNKVQSDASAPYFWAAFQLVGDWRSTP